MVTPTFTPRPAPTGRQVLTNVPLSGPRGTEVFIVGTGFTPSGTIAANTITVDGVATVHSGVNLTPEGYTPGISLTIPAAAGIGSKTISLTDSGSLTGTTKFTVTVPTLTIGLASAYMGQSVPITGAGWVPNSEVLIALASDSVLRATKVVVAHSLGSYASGAIDTDLTVPSTVGVGPKTVTFTAYDSSTYGNTAAAQTMSIPKPTVILSVSEANIGDVVLVAGYGFAPYSGLSALSIGGADVRSGVVTSDSEGMAMTSFIVPGVTGSNIVTVTIGANTASTSIFVP